MKGKMLGWIIFIIAVCVACFLSNEQEKEKGKIVENVQYTVGEVLKYNPGNSIATPGYSSASSAFVEYRYNVKDQIIINFNTRGSANLPEGGVTPGQQYLVVYNSNQPGESRMLFDKPIQDSADLDRYKDELTEN